MLALKLVYNNKTDIESFSGLKGIMETYNEDNYNERKKGLTIKKACSAKETPFMAVYFNDKLIKGFYSEANECTVMNVAEWLTDFVETNAKRGWIEIEKISGKNLDKHPIGMKRSGYTQTFMEGVRCIMSTMSKWYATSIITEIDWKNNTFKTLNSVYKFNFKEYDSKNREQGTSASS